MIDVFLKEISGIYLFDVGSSGTLSPKFNPIVRFIHLTGFDPNARECERMNQAPHPYLSAHYLPYAIAGENGDFSLHVTQNAQCYSLLEPNLPWLRRFSYSDLFEVTRVEQIHASTLDSLEEIRNIPVDIIKTDTQGLELPILSTSKRSLSSAFYVETETGFVQNYIHETTFSEIDQFMRENYFLLFDINPNHRISRNNPLRENVSNEQILWCEATWLKDYVALYHSGKTSGIPLTREKVLKCLVLCALQGCFSYGYELAVLFKDLGFLDAGEVELLKSKESWMLGRLPETKKLPIRFLMNGLRLLPSRWRTQIKEAAMVAENQKHLLRR